jgi:hypothetical protein
MKTLTTTPAVLRPGLFPGFVPGASAYPGRGSTLAAKAA